MAVRAQYFHCLDMMLDAGRHRPIVRSNRLRPQQTQLGPRNTLSAAFFGLSFGLWLTVTSYHRRAAYAALFRSADAVFHRGYASFFHEYGDEEQVGLVLLGIWFCVPRNVAQLISRFVLFEGSAHRSSPPQAFWHSRLRGTWV